MGLSDAHSVYGVLLAQLFYEHHRQHERLQVPSSFSSALKAVLRDQSLRRAPWRRFLVAGVALANLPDVDVLAAALLRKWDKTHRGPTHSLLFWLASSAVACIPLSLWLRTSRVRALLFALACGGSHLLSDWIGSAGVPLWSPLSGTRYALGCVTVTDATLALANCALFAASRSSRRPLLLLSAWLLFVAAYLRWKTHHMRLARGYFDHRHRLSGDSVFVHPWSLFPRTFSLVRSSDGAVVETVTTSAIVSKREFVPSALPNLSNAAAVRRMYLSSRGVLLDAAVAVALGGGFWAWQAVAWYRRRQEL